MKRIWVIICLIGLFSACWVFPQTALATDIPTLKITMADGSSLEQLNTQPKGTKFTQNSWQLFDTSGNIILEGNQDLQIKGRGNSTWLLDKKPYQLKFDSKQTLFGSTSAKKWVLLANAYDESSLRNDAAFYLAENMNMAGVETGLYVNLYIDNLYLGMYYITHQVENGKASISLKNEDGIIVEIDNVISREADDLYSYTIEGSRLVVKDAYDADNESQTQNALNDITSTYNEVYKAAENQDWDYIKSHIDVDSFIQYYLLNNYTSNVDGFLTSYFIYKDGANDVLHAGPAWDFDLAFGGNWYQRSTSDSTNTSRDWTWGTFRQSINKDNSSYEEENNMITNQLCSLLNNIPQFREQVKLYYQSTFKNLISKLPTYIEQKAATIEASAQENNEKWNLSSFISSKNYLINWCKARNIYFDILYSDDANIEDGSYIIMNQQSNSEFLSIEYDSSVDSYKIAITGSQYLIGSSQKNRPEITLSYNFNNYGYWNIVKYNNSFVFINKMTGRFLTYNGKTWYESDALSNKTYFSLRQSNIKRLSGNIAITTSIAIAEEKTDSADTVIIATEDGYHDSLSAAGLAGCYDAPILLTSKNSLPISVREEIKKLGASHIVIVGGIEAVSATVENQLKNISTVSQVERLWGQTAIETANAIGERINSLNDNKQTCIISSADGYYDATSISSYAYAYKVPIYLFSANEGYLRDSAASLISQYNTIYITGGEVSVPSNAITAATKGKKIIRLGGRDAYDTCNIIATYMIQHNLLTAEEPGICCISTEISGTDGMCASTLLGQKKSVLLGINLKSSLGDYNIKCLTGVDSDGNAGVLKTYKNQIKQVYIFGGNEVVPKDIFSIINTDILTS